MSNYNRVYDYDQILQWIIQYKTTHDGVGPSMREMVKGCGRLVRLEVKTDEGEPLTDREAITFRMFPGACYRVWDVEQVQPIIFDEEDK